MIVLRGKVGGQFVVNGIFGQPLQGRLRRVFRRLFRAAKSFDMHHKRPILRKIHGLFRHDYLAVEVGIEINHRTHYLVRLCQTQRLEREPRLTFQPLNPAPEQRCTEGITDFRNAPSCIATISLHRTFSDMPS
jgi:hypothetical protein